MSALVDAFGSPLFRRAMLEAVLVGALAGIVGVHVVLRRLPFFVTAMSHATFPGVVIASTLGFSLLLGGASFGLIVVALIVTPAATARLVCHRVGPSMGLAAAIGALGGMAGLLVAFHASVDHDVRFAPGATIVVVLTAIFAVVATANALRRA